MPLGQIVQGALDTYACECAVEAEVPVKMSGGDRGMPSDNDMSEPSAAEEQQQAGANA